MQHVVLRRFYDACVDVPFIGKWPTVQELTEWIKNLPEYRALCDVGHPDGKEMILHEVEEMVNQHIDCIQQIWLKNTLHKCLSIDDLQAQLENDCGGPIPTDTYHNPIVLFEVYYHSLEMSIAQTLLADSTHMYDDHELEFMIPFVKSYLFDRERVKNYYKRNRKL